MNLKKIDEADNKLLNRKIVRYELAFDDKMPSKLDVKKELVNSLNVKEELLDVKLHHKYGQHLVDVEAYIYGDVNVFNIFKKKAKGKKEEVKKEVAK